jgi:hypothetical protein
MKEVAALAADEDAIAFAYTFSGTQNGSLMGIPATGSKVKIRGIQIPKFCWREDGGALGEFGSARDVAADWRYGCSAVVGKREIRWGFEFGIADQKRTGIAGDDCKLPVKRCFDDLGIGCILR